MSVGAVAGPVTEVQGPSRPQTLSAIQLLGLSSAPVGALSRLTSCEMTSTREPAWLIRLTI